MCRYIHTKKILSSNFNKIEPEAPFACLHLPSTLIRMFPCTKEFPDDETLGFRRKDRRVRGGEGGPTTLLSSSGALWLSLKTVYASPALYTVMQSYMDQITWLYDY